MLVQKLSIVFKILAYQLALMLKFVCNIVFNLENTLSFYKVVGYFICDICLKLSYIN